LGLFPFVGTKSGSHRRLVCEQGLKLFKLISKKHKPSSCKEKLLGFSISYRPKRNVNQIEANEKSSPKKWIFIDFSPRGYKLAIKLTFGGGFAVDADFGDTFSGSIEGPKNVKKPKNR
jgi:hypothetical protein